MSKQKKEKDETNLYLSLPDESKTTNQTYYRINLLQQMMEKQNEMNNLIRNSLNEIQLNIKDTSNEQCVQYTRLWSKLNKQDDITYHFLEMIKNHELINQAIIDRLSELEQKDQLVLSKMEKEEIVNRSILDQLDFQDDVLTKLSSKLEEYHQSSQTLISTLDKTEKLYKELSSKSNLQEVYHQTVMERLDHQEANTNKMMRQIDQLRHIIFERATFLVGKVEENLNKMSKPVQRFFVQQDNKVDKK